MHVITMARDHSQERCGEQVAPIIGFQPKKIKLQMLTLMKMQFPRDTYGGNVDTNLSD